MRQPNPPKTLVVGTTPDYIDLIRARWPNRAVFLTDPAQRPTPTLPPHEELVFDLMDEEGAANAAIKRFGSKTISAVAVYDCESMVLASKISQKLGLWSQPVKALEIARSKLLSKLAWQKAKVPCPSVAIVKNQAELEEAFRKIGPQLILKPLTGAGSELVYRVEGLDEAKGTFSLILERLKHHPDARMYQKSGDWDPRACVVVEKCVQGPELSCEFVLEGGKAKMFRLTEKLLEPQGNRCFVRAYRTLRDFESHPALRQNFDGLLAKCATSLGFSQGLMMADFIIQGDEPVFLELTPRASGDCLPHLTRHSCGLDTIGLTLDLAEGKMPRLPRLDEHKDMVGLRLVRRESGTIAKLDATALKAHPSVVEVGLIREPGYEIVPSQYDDFSTLLGYAIFRFDTAKKLSAQCDELENLLEIDLEKA